MLNTENDDNDKDLSQFKYKSYNSDSDTYEDYSSESSSSSSSDEDFESYLKRKEIRCGIKSKKLSLERSDTEEEEIIEKKSLKETERKEQRESNKGSSDKTINSRLEFKNFGMFPIKDDECSERSSDSENDIDDEWEHEARKKREEAIKKRQQDEADYKRIMSEELGENDSDSEEKKGQSSLISNEEMEQLKELSKFLNFASTVNEKGLGNTIFNKLNILTESKITIPKNNNINLTEQINNKISLDDLYKSIDLDDCAYSDMDEDVYMSSDENLLERDSLKSEIKNNQENIIVDGSAIESGNTEKTDLVTNTEPSMITGFTEKEILTKIHDSVLKDSKKKDRIKRRRKVQRVKKREKEREVKKKEKEKEKRERRKISMRQCKDKETANSVFKERDLRENRSLITDNMSKKSTLIGAKAYLSKILFGADKTMGSADKESNNNNIKDMNSSYTKLDSLPKTYENRYKISDQINSDRSNGGSLKILNSNSIRTSREIVVRDTEQENLKFFEELKLEICKMKKDDEIDIKKIFEERRRFNDANTLNLDRLSVYIKNNLDEDKKIKNCNLFKKEKFEFFGRRKKKRKKRLKFMNDNEFYSDPVNRLKKKKVKNKQNSFKNNIELEIYSKIRPRKSSFYKYELSYNKYEKRLIEILFFKKLEISGNHIRMRKNFRRFKKFICNVSGKSSKVSVSLNKIILLYLSKKEKNNIDPQKFSFSKMLDIIFKLEKFVSGLAYNNEIRILEKEEYKAKIRNRTITKKYKHGRRELKLKERKKKTKKKIYFKNKNRIKNKIKLLNQTRKKWG